MMKNTISYTCTLIISGMLLTAGAAQEDSIYRDYSNRQCPILDTPFQSLSSLEIGYTMPAKNNAEGWDDVAVAEINTWLRLLYLENESGSDLEMKLMLDSYILQGFDGSDSSYSMTMARMLFRWDQRFEYGLGMQLEAQPGIYSTLDSLSGDFFAVPCGFNLIYAFSGNTAIFAGANVYPGFDLEVEPRGGFHFSSTDQVIIELAYPESKFVYRPCEWFRLTIGGRIMEWPQFSMGDDHRKTIYYEEMRAYAGFDFCITDYTEIYLRCGEVFDRTISFEADSSDVEIEDAMFFKFGIGGRL